jgi:hypothetical protein
MMGTMRHHAIVVTSSDSLLLNQAQTMASVLGLVITEVVRSKANDYHSFCVLPDGSKEGWEESKKMDERRDALVEWMRYQQLDWVEVQFADEAEDGGTKIVRDSSEGRRGVEVDIAPLGGGG